MVDESSCKIWSNLNPGSPHHFIILSYYHHPNACHVQLMTRITITGPMVWHLLCLRTTFCCFEMLDRSEHHAPLRYPCNVSMYHDASWWNLYFGRQELWINPFPLLPASPVKDVTVFLPLLHALIRGVAERICTTWSRRLCPSASTWTRTARLYRWFIVNFHSHSPVISTGPHRTRTPSFAWFWWKAVFIALPGRGLMMDACGVW